MAAEILFVDSEQVQNDGREQQKDCSVQQVPGS